VQLEELLARVLRYGTWLASAAIGLGFALALMDSNPHMRIATVGIVLFILLPVLRVLLMLLFFIRDRDVRFAALAALVLAIILAGILLGGG
jgi:uncharacterized membrane protein